MAGYSAAVLYAAAAVAAVGEVDWLESFDSLSVPGWLDHVSPAILSIMYHILFLVLAQSGGEDFAAPDVRHFPSEQQLFDLNELNTKFYVWASIQADLGGWRADWYREQFDEARHWYYRYCALLKVREKWSVYRAMTYAVDPSSYALITCQDEYYAALEFFQYLIGHEAFVLGELGSPIPLWCFSRD